MSLKVYRHADGGHYVIDNERNVSMKMDDGRWEPGVVYRAVDTDPGGGFMYRDGNFFVTTRKRWEERFTPVAESNDGKRKSLPAPEQQS